MRKNDIINAYAEKTGATKTEAKKIVETVIDVLTDGIVNDGVVDIHKFVKFEVVEVPERTRVYTMGENKGEEYVVPAHMTVKAKVKSAVKELVNG